MSQRGNAFSWISVADSTTLPANEREEYAKVFYEFNSLYQDPKIKLPTTFVDPIRPKDVKLKNGKRRGLSLLEALEEEEAEKRRRRRAESIEQARLERHNALLQSQNNANNPNPFFQDSNRPSQQSPDLSDQDLSDGPQFTSDVPAYESEDKGSDNDIQYLGTQARFQSPVLPSNFSQSDLIPDPEISESDFDDLIDIDKLLSQQVPPPLVSLSQNLTASQLPPSTAPVMTRTARGVVRKRHLSCNAWNRKS